MTERIDRQHLLGYIFIAIALIMVAQGVWLQWKHDQEADCQADYNQATNAAIAQRGTWADEDRKALNTMIFTVIDPQASDKVKQQAVLTYADTARANDQNRQANPLPSRTSCG